MQQNSFITLIISPELAADLTIVAAALIAVAIFYYRKRKKEKDKKDILDQD